jgi:hypothetical protein
MKPLLVVVTFLALLTPLWAAEPDWSEPVNGVRARLSLERQKDSPFLKVFIEFQNTSDTAGIKKLRFTPNAIHAQVVDDTGKPLKTPIGSYDGITPTWAPLGLPFEGTLRFRISFPGMGYRPDQDHTIIDFGPEACWVVPADTSYFLSGTLTIPKEEGDHPHSDWNGTLTFPKIPIPTK